MGRKGSLRNPRNRLVLAAIAALGLLLLSAAAPGAPAPAHLAKLVGTCPVGGIPITPVWDPSDRLMFVTNYGNSGVSFLNGSCVTRSSFPVGNAPWGAAYDPANHFVYVTDSLSNVVYVFNGTALVTTVSGKFAAPESAVYDPLTREILVANAGSDNLTVIQGLKVKQTIRVGIAPDGVSYDPRAKTILVADGGGTNVTILNASSPKSSPHRSVPVGDQPVAIAFDPSDDDDYVSDASSFNVSVVTGSGTVVGAVSLPVRLNGNFSQPEGLAYSDREHAMYVADFGLDQVWIVQRLKISGNVSLPGAGPYGVARDPLTGDMFVTGYSTGRVYVLR